MAVPTQLSDLSATAASNSPAGGDTVGTTMDDFIRAHASIIARISAGTDALATPNIGAATGTSLVLSGLATVNGAFTSLGLDDNATTKALTLSGSGANSVTIANSATNPIIGTSAGSLVLQSAGVASLVLSIGGVDYAAISGGSGDVSISAAGGTSSVNFTVAAKGATGQVNITANSAVQAVILPTASANRYITLTGSAGGNPTIGTSAGGVNISPGGTLALAISAVASAANYMTILPSASGGGFISIGAAGADAGISINISPKGSGSIALYGEGVPQAVVLATASANRYITLTGSNGANPKIGTSAGQLTLGTGSALATSATEGYVCIPTCAGAPTGVPAGAGAGNLPLIYDTTNNKLYAYNGAWKATAALT